MTEETKIDSGGKKKLDGTMSFLDHLDELRTRLIRFVIVLALCVLATYFYRKEILDLIRKPVDAPLKKYTAVSSASANKKIDLATSGAYNCVCREIAPVAEAPVEGDAEMDVVDDSMVGSSSDASGDMTSTITENLEQAGTILQKIGATLDDFVMFFQVMLDKEPSPIFTDRAPPESERVSTAGRIQAVPGSINLNCQCSIDQAPPSSSSTMVYIGLPELFFSQMKVAIFAGFFLAFPYLLIELWGFIGPALYSGEKKVFWIFSIFSYLFFTGGALFGYFVVFPFGVDFFLSLTQLGEIMPSLSVGEYLSFALKLLMAFGFIFELPLVTFILARMGILTPKIMIQQSRVAILVVFVISAVLTPPDPFTMMLMSGPLIILYIISIGVCFLGLNRQKAAMRAQGMELDEDE